MLRAINHAGEDVLGWNAVKGEHYYCPACEGPVVFKPGRTVTPHFAHLAQSDCEYAEGESAAHLAMKATMARMFSESAVRLEVPMLPGHRADLVVPAARVVIECQASKIQAAEWERRTRNYNRMGYAVLWVWDRKRLTAGPYKGEVRVPDEMRLCHKEQWGHVYVLDGTTLLAAHLETIRRYGEDYYDSDGYMQSSTDRYLKTIKDLSLKQVTLPLRLERNISPTKYALVHLGDGAWWKRNKWK